jgi:hypothetical protein
MNGLYLAMLQELKTIQTRFEPLLKPGYYTFIGPVDQKYFDPFLRRVNDAAPGKLFNHSIHDDLANKDAIDIALAMFPDGFPLRIYVVSAADSQILLYDTIKGYCEEHGVDFQE